MTKKLRKRIMLTMMLLLSITYIAILVAINVWINANTRSDADNALRFLMRQHEPQSEMIPDGDVTPPEKSNDTSDDNTFSGRRDNDFIPPKDDFPKMDEKSMEILSSHYILVRYKSDGTLDSIDNTLSDSYTNEEITSYCEDILQKKENHGSIGQLRYMIRQSKIGTEIFFIDHTAENKSGQRLLIISIILGAVGLVIFAILSYAISGLMVRPVEETFEKQKQFISDASHELKTPITVILSNSELLEEQIGSSQWLTYIKNECDRMRNLVESLLTLTKLEQVPYTDVIKNDFSLSNAMLERILPIESVAFEKDIHMNYDIEPDVNFFGVKEQIQQVLTILMDNALNHTNAQGSINITLQKAAHYIRFQVTNTGEPISKEDQEKLFERFYRVDKARNRAQGHYGLGLSIAKTIVENHHGKISVHCEDGYTTFTVSLPTRS